MPPDALDDLLADRDIRAVLVRYCRGIDRMDAPMTRSCWHADGTADYGRLFKGTADGFIEWLWPVHAAMIGHVHRLSNVTVELDTERAATESYVHVVLRVPATDGGQVDIVGRGRYLDRFELRDGIWAIAHRTYVSDLASTQRVEQLDIRGQLPPAQPGLVGNISARDHSDVSYALLGGSGR
jgi:SnoaL-like domain